MYFYPGLTGQTTVLPAELCGVSTRYAFIHNIIAQYIGVVKEMWGKKENNL
jgi:hypothetical protein